MLNLSIKEQKQVVGGRWVVTIRYPDGSYYGKREFWSEKKAKECVEDFEDKGYYARIDTV